jgi:predicted O-methyltransferase YrrM
VDEGISFDAVFLDFAKAFDKVLRERLLKKVRAHGV